MAVYLFIYIYYSLYVHRASARLLRLSVWAVPAITHRHTQDWYQPSVSQLFLSVCVCATDIWSRSSFRVTTFTFLNRANADVGRTIDLVAYRRLTFTDCNQTHFVANFGFIRYIAGGFDVFLSCFNVVVFLFLERTMIDMIWSGWARKTEQELYALLHHTDAVWSRMKAEWEKLFSPAALSKQKRNCPVAIL